MHIADLLTKPRLHAHFSLLQAEFCVPPDKLVIVCACTFVEGSQL